MESSLSEIDLCLDGSFGQDAWLQSPQSADLPRDVRLEEAHLKNHSDGFARGHRLFPAFPSA